MPTKKASLRPSGASEHLALRYHRLGRQLLKVGSVSEAEFNSLAAELDLRATADVWYKSIRVARRYDRSELVSLCRWRQPRSAKMPRRISWTHVLELMDLPTQKQRERFAAMAARENLGCISLRIEVRKMTNWTSKRPGAGRKRQEPLSDADAIWRAIRDIKRLTATLVWMKTNERKRSRLRKEMLDVVTGLDGLKKSLEHLFGVS